MKIAITGEQCAGKTTIADMLMDELGGNRIKFIDKLYQVNDLLGVKKNRGFMQDMGEAVRNYFGQDYFINDFILRSKTSNTHLFSDDVRKIKELEAAKIAGFTTVFVSSTASLRKQRATLLGLAFIEDHPAEKEIVQLQPRCDIQIENNGTLEELKQQIINSLKPVIS